MHIVAVGTGAAAADRAASVLKRWTQDSDGQGAPHPAGPTKADPKIRQELAWLERALSAGDRQTLNVAGGGERASDRCLQLSQLPEGTPTKTTARGAIDRFSAWSTIRLISPEATT